MDFIDLKKKQYLKKKNTHTHTKKKNFGFASGQPFYCSWWKKPISTRFNPLTTFSIRANPFFSLPLSRIFAMTYCYFYKDTPIDNRIDLIGSVDFILLFLIETKITISSLFPKGYTYFPGFIGIYWVLLGFTWFYWYYWFLLGLIEFLLSFTRFFWKLPGFTGYYRVLLEFTGFYRVLLGFTGFYWVLLGFT